MKGSKDRMDEESVEIEVEKEQKENKKVKEKIQYDDRLEEFIDVRP